MTHAQSEKVRLLGLDIGSTTSSALVAEARIGASSVSGRMQLETPRTLFRSPTAFTPFDDDDIDAEALAKLLDEWLIAGHVGQQRIFAGGAIITGLAAQARNARIIAKLIRDRMGDALIATADDPRLESWLAFMGGCAGLSRMHPQVQFLNLDIGGGTTNAALGMNGEVLDTACHFIGARHLRFAPGTYRLAGISTVGMAILRDRDIHKRCGDLLSADEVNDVIDYNIRALEAVVRGRSEFFNSPMGKVIEQVCFNNAPPADVVITFSGGVGELIYRIASGESAPSTTFFGDLGIDLAQAIIASPLLSRSLPNFIPEQGGRATLYGITLHNTEISGNTLYLPQPDLLPLVDLPILGCIRDAADTAHMMQLLAIARMHSAGAAVQIEMPIASDSTTQSQQIRSLGENIAKVLDESKFPSTIPLVILLPINAGKTLGQYATRWGTLPVKLMVVDEVPVRGAHFINIGRLRQQVVPISFFGIR
ncbi:MAG: ethanolamine ammonia-lyase reactivating factor EutA [Gammaproteobacteria bacterium]